MSLNSSRNFSKRVSNRVKWLYSGAEKALYTYGIRKADPACLPDFLGIGLRKTGTTWLYENLHEHPEVFVGPRKSLYYFDKHFSDSLQSYLDYFKAFKQSDKKAKGEVTTGYALMPEGRIRFLRRILPDVRLILLLRNPIEREWSLVVHRCVQHRIPVESLTEAEMLALFRKSTIYRLGGYTALLERWCSIFPPEQLHIGLYDDIKACPQKLLAGVFAHIGVSCAIDWRQLPYHEVIVPPNAPEYRDSGRDLNRGVVVRNHTNSAERFPSVYRAVLMDMYQSDIESLQKVLGERVHHWLARGEEESEHARNP